VIIFVKNFFKYAFVAKVPINILNVFSGQKCTLKCKYCAQSIPYLKQDLYDIDVLIEDVQKLLALCHLKQFIISGGEPFIHPELYKLLNWLAECQEIEEVEIFTNATIIPNQQTIDALKNLAPKLCINVDIYKGHEGIAQKFIRLLKKENYTHKIVCDPTTKWTKLFDMSKQVYSIEDTLENFRHCSAKFFCNALANGELTVCSRGITTDQLYDFKSNPFDKIKIQNLKSGAWGKAQIATCLSKGPYKEFCRYCRGASALNPKTIPAGEQLTREEISALKN
jgi:hypothetical protein